jgi:serine/threonine protein kinase
VEVCFNTRANTSDAKPIGSLPIDDASRECDYMLSATIDQLPRRMQPVTHASMSEPSKSGFGRFELLKFHAKGGLGQVWIARDQECRREVAVKQVIPERMTSQLHRNQFETEAMLTASLEHPSIAPVYGFGHDPNGDPYYAMRFLTGITLEDGIKEYHSVPRVGTDDARAFYKLLKSFIDVCNAVALAHSRSVIHRDIKPSNILLGDFGEAYLVDWGLAQPISEVTQEVVGTLMYMSPEQAAGGLVGPLSDVYSLGATLYALITGHAPYDDLSSATTVSESECGGHLLKRIIAGKYIPPRDRDLYVDAQIAAICMKAMERDPESRFRSVRELITAVETYLAELPIRQWKRSVKHFEKIVESGHQLTDFNELLARSHHNLGTAYWGQQRFEEAITHLSKAKQILGSLQQRSVDREIAMVCVTLSRVYAQLRKKTEALAEYAFAQDSLTQYYADRGIEIDPALMLQMFEPSDVGFMRYLRGTAKGVY